MKMNLGDVSPSYFPLFSSGFTFPSCYTFPCPAYSFLASVLSCLMGMILDGWSGWADEWVGGWSFLSLNIFAFHDKSIGAVLVGVFGEFVWGLPMG